MRQPQTETAPFALLRTKFQRPRLRENLLPRPRLLEKLGACLGRDAILEGGTLEGKLILVSAPAGYGKTTALGQWLDDCPCPSAWLSLDDGDSDLGVFLTYFTGAVQTVYPDACPFTSSLLESHQMVPHAHLASTLTNELTALPDRLVLVLDDFHRVEGEAVPKLVERLLGNLSPQVCLAIATRLDPNLPLIRLRASGEMIELRMADLCFSPDEVQSFLQRAVGPGLSDEIVETLEDRTEGWIVGLRLAALSLRGARDPGAFVQSFQASGHRYVTQYLVEEVFSLQSPAIRDFLLRTAILDRFCAPLCDAVLDRQDSQTILEEIDQANLFLMPLDFEGKWYRYHHLLRDLLAQRLLAQTSGGDIEFLHAQASAWFAGNGLIEEAMTHALSAGDVTGAARLVEANYRQAINHSQWARLRRWVGHLPDSIIEQRPGLLLAKCWCLHRLFKLKATVPVSSAAAALLEMPEAIAELDIDEQEQLYLLGEINVLRSQASFFLGDAESGLACAEKSLAQLPEAFPYARSTALFYWALSAQVLGRAKEATNRLYETIQTETESSPLVMHVFTGLCMIHRSSAESTLMLRVGKHFLRYAQKVGQLEAEAFAHYHLGDLYYEWNELEKARFHFEEAINLRYHAHEFCTFTSLQGLALVHLALGRLKESQACDTAARAFAQQTESELLLAWNSSFEARLSLLQGDLEQADRKSREVYGGSQVESMAVFEPPSLNRAMVLIARATPESTQEALALLDELLAYAENSHYILEQIQILALQAMALDALGRSDKALSRLEEAVTLARPGWMVRSFVDLGPILADLLRKLAQRGVAVDYLAQVLAAFDVGGKDRPPVVPPESEMVEPLTERELEILHLLEKRLTNREIAQRLVVSPMTVKRHASNIYQKLSVSNRRQAAVKARDLGILPPD